ncbi:MAG: hypothetical protein V4447_06010 [Pseudomonadota bacterium]
MKIQHITLIRLLIASGVALAAPTSFACSSCGCTLSSDWDSQGYATVPGGRIDLRYDFLNQSELRNGTSGTAKLKPASMSLPSDREIEQGTKNHYVTLGLDFNAGKNWGVNVQIPYIYRSHETIAEGDTDISSSKTSNIGDVKVLGRYLGLSEEKNFGLQFGLKLPTGSFHDNFSNGPQTGKALDRGLQAGTGSTDLLLGVFHFAALNQNWDYFAQGNVQLPFSERDGYKTGTSLNANFGLRYMANETVIPQLQINAKAGHRDSGSDADAENSGGSLMYISPGVTVSLSEKLKVFGFLQLPLYQNVNGVQLAPRYTVSLGMRYAM